MQTEHAIWLPARTAPRTVKVAAVVAGSLLIALSAQVAIPVPFSPVPLTLQPLAVLLVGALLGPLAGAAAASLYLLEGLAGLPVFAQGRGGMVTLIGPTAGYLYAFPAAAFVAGLARGPVLRILGTLAAAIALIHLGGWSWLAAAIGLSPSAAFGAGVAPFLVNDLLKIAIATGIVAAVQAKSHRRQSRDS
jgi:biotin transport system substrate-specific component